MKKIAASSTWVLAALLWSAVAAAESGAESEPRLVLPGDHVVRAGQTICLRWNEADAVTELEILLSLDGGLHYRVCISPRLDPGRHEFVWRVPPEATGELRMRIRYNRNGREIEGAPSAPLVVARGSGQPEPLGLPPDQSEREPRPAGGGGTPATRGTAGWLEAADDDALPERPSVRPDHAMLCAPAGARDLLLLMVPPFAPPRSMPLRT